MPAFNIDLHHHCSSDPVDRLFYNEFQLVDQSVAAGLHAIAITPHGSVYHHPAAILYARTKGLLLIPGIEKMIEGREIVLLNVQPDEIPDTFTFADLQALRGKRGNSIFAFAPHPFYPRSTCAGPVLNEIKGLIDAVEYAHLYFSFYNRPNQIAVDWARANGKPVIANSDSHDLSMVGKNYTVIEAENADACSLFTALKTNPTRLVSQPYSLKRTLFFFGRVMFPLQLHHLGKYLRP